MYQAAPWRAAKSARIYMVIGGMLGLVTIVLSALNAISAQQSIALSLPAVVLTVRGVMGHLISDSWTAWRRGFQQGCLAATQYYLPESESDPSALESRL
jgi:hypothetical protein